MENLSIVSSSIEETKAFAKNFAKNIKDTKTIAFLGDLGSGKTTFIKSLVSSLNKIDENEITIFVNSKICEMLGYNKNEMMGKNLHFFLEESMEELIDSNREKREKLR